MEDDVSSDIGPVDQAEVFEFLLDSLPEARSLVRGQTLTLSVALCTCQSRRLLMRGSAEALDRRVEGLRRSPVIDRTVSFAPCADIASQSRYVCVPLFVVLTVSL